VLSANGKYIPVEASGTLPGMVVPFYICPKEREILDSGNSFIYSRKLKAQRLRWTTAWRRLHKKIKITDQSKLKKKKAFKQ
jgi:hypothetical protein